MRDALVIVITGVVGSGKTTVGELLARQRQWNFRDGDGFHPAANIAKMSAGGPLSDDDRAPWLAAIAAYIRECPHFLRRELLPSQFEALDSPTGAFELDIGQSPAELAHGIRQAFGL